MRLPVLPFPLEAPPPVLDRGVRASRVESVKKFVSLFLVGCGAALLAGCGESEESVSKEDYDELAERVGKLEDLLGVKPSEPAPRAARVREPPSNGIFGESKETIARNWVSGIGKQYLTLYERRHGQLPEKLDDLFEDDSRHGPIALEKDLQDPWGNQYRYKRTGGRTYELWTVTRDYVKISSLDE